MNAPRHIIGLVMLASVVWLTGCAGSAGAPSMFLLENADTTTGASRVSGPTLVIDPVTVAPFLSESGIVYQTGPHRVVIANNNRWASPLDSQLTDGLYTALSDALSDVSVRHYGRQTGASAMHLATQVDEFMGHYDGHAHITGRWQLIGPDGTTLVGRQFSQRLPLASDGYDALVGSLSRGWRNTADDMAPALDDAIDAAGSSLD